MTHVYTTRGTPKQEMLYVKWSVEIWKCTKVVHLLLTILN